MHGTSRLRGFTPVTGWFTLLAFGGVVAVLALVCVRSIERSSEATPVEWAELKKEIRRRFPRASQISTDELAAWLRRTGEGNGPGSEARPLLLDARTPEEHAVSHLPGAVSAPDAESALKVLRDAGAETPVVVYCSVGWRSSDLVQQLRDRGVETVWNLEGSIFQWANEDRPVVRDGLRVRQVHPYDESWGRFLEPSLRTYEPESEGDGPP